MELPEDEIGSFSPEVKVKKAISRRETNKDLRQTEMTNKNQFEFIRKLGNGAYG